MMPRTLCLAGFCIASATAVVWACGGWFPSGIVLTTRKSAMLSAPPSSFTAYVQTLVAVEDAALVAQEGDEDVVAWEATHLPPAQAALVAQMRQAATPAQAEAIGRALPAAIREYTAGAVAFVHARGDGAVPGDVAAAIAHFDAVLALPASDATDRAVDRTVWAQYMLGRAYRLRAAAGDEGRAIQAFQATRRRVLGGAADPLGLAVGSYGEQALVALDRADLITAGRLYAQQAAHQSMSGRNSLLRLSKLALESPERAALLRDPVLQRLIVGYVLDRLDSGNEPRFYAPEGDAAVERQVSADQPYQPERSAAASDATTRLLESVLDSIQQIGPEHWVDTSMLANAAYQSSRFDWAERFAKLNRTTQSAWILAKLATRQGDFAEAARQYAAAIRLMPLPPDAGYDSEQHKLIASEWGALQLSRGDYTDALRHLLDAGSEYVIDMAYLCERVLSADELKDFVEREVPESTTTDANSEQSWYWSRKPADMVRGMLARRLMREGRYAEAQRYFGEHTIEPDGESAQRLSDLAGRYAALMSAADSGWRGLSRAQAAFEAAKLARHYGMELFGYEAAPDFKAFDGQFDLSGDAGPALNAAGFFTADEVQRFNASMAQPEKRFHYRYQAADLAARAADLLPPRSQAFAAVLCEATRWVIDRDADLAAKIYRRYLREGAYVEWGANFGRTCPEPEFGRAEALQRQQRLDTVHRLLRSYRPLIYGIALVATLTLFFTALAKLRRRRAAL